MLYKQSFSLSIFLYYFELFLQNPLLMLFETHQQIAGVTTYSQSNLVYRTLAVDDQHIQLMKCMRMDNIVACLYILGKVFSFCIKCH
jgi:hypothetical protein